MTALPTAQRVNGPERPVLPEILVLDTCVLISSVLRVLLLQLAAGGWFEPVWSPVIGDEWRRTAGRLWQTSNSDIAHQWEVLQLDFPNADIGDVSHYKEGLQRSDPKDWHVIAAARAALSRSPDATVAILTRNIKDFHRAELRRLGIYLFDPDQWMSRLWLQKATSLSPYLAQLPDAVRSHGRESDTLETVLKRERLFRLNRLTQAVS